MTPTAEVRPRCPTESLPCPLTDQTEPWSQDRGYRQGWVDAISTPSTGYIAWPPTVEVGPA